MKALLHIFRRPRKIVVLIAGVALVIGGSGASALYVGKDAIFGAPRSVTSGLECTDVNLVTIKKQDHVWVRKYIKTDSTDGMTRVKTALRVAKAVYDTQKPDLVQVVVLDRNGPTMRSDMRGRAFGADVIVAQHPEKLGDASINQPITAAYYDGPAGPSGLFYGERIDLDSHDIDLLVGNLRDHSDCVDPVAAEVKEKGEGKGKKGGKSAHGEEKAKTAEGHDENVADEKAHDDKGHEQNAGEEKPPEGEAHKPQESADASGTSAH